jgi:recombination protein RecR
VREQPGVIGRLIAEFVKLPGIGPKSAERLVHHLLSGDRRQGLLLADALRAVVEQIRPCIECFNLCEGERCPICSDDRRDPQAICVVETPRDLTVFERMGSFKGRYHVLGGRLAPLENVGPENLTIDALMRRIQRSQVKEIILATSPTTEGDGTALYLSNLLMNSGLVVTRLARGLASGSSLELASSQMLADAFEGRRTF